MSSQPPRSFPTRSIAFGLLLTTALIGVGSWNAWRLNGGLKTLATGEVRLTHLDGVIIHLDEVLTMSARMAAATGDPAWERRYHQYEPTLDAAIQEVLAMAPDLQSRSHSQKTDAANKSLVEMELRAFSLARAGDRDAAIAVLLGPEYEAQKKIYAAGMASTMEEAGRHFEQQVTAHRQLVVTLVAIGVALFLLLIGVWARVVFLLRGYIAARQGAETALRESNENLEDRVAARTRELSEAVATLEANDKLSSLGMLAAGIAHEINNPMAYVTSNVSSLLEDLKGAGELSVEMQEYVDDVLPSTLDGIRRVNTIVGDLRRFARGDVEGMVQYDLNAEVSAAVRISRNQLRDGCRIEIALGAIPRLIGKPQQIAQTLVNLIVNAAQAMDGRSNGLITVATSTEDEAAVLIVRDNGIGMPPETVRQLFQPFFTTKPVGKGTGLGLSVAYGIVKSHGGIIEVESQPGQGSQFLVRLPFAPPLPAIASPPPTGQGSSFRSSPQATTSVGSNR